MSDEPLNPKIKNAHTQTAPQPKEASVCLPLPTKTVNGETVYCYHGGKCTCENCKIVRNRQKDDLDKKMETFVPHSTLKLEVPMRLAQPREYNISARRVGPEFGMHLLKKHLETRKNVPIYYLPDKYFVKDLWRYPIPEEKATQTALSLGHYGMDGCPCADKSICKK